MSLSAKENTAGTAVGTARTLLRTNGAAQRSLGIEWSGGRLRLITIAAARAFRLLVETDVCGEWSCLVRTEVAESDR
jgi:hypothetical protein